MAPHPVPGPFLPRHRVGVARPRNPAGYDPPAPPVDPVRPRPPGWLHPPGSPIGCGGGAACGLHIRLRTGGGGRVGTGPCPDAPLSDTPAPHADRYVENRSNGVSIGCGGTVFHVRRGNRATARAPPTGPGTPFHLQRGMHDLPSRAGTALERFSTFGGRPRALRGSQRRRRPRSNALGFPGSRAAMGPSDAALTALPSQQRRRVPVQGDPDVRTLRAEGLDERGAQHPQLRGGRAPQQEVPAPAAVEALDG